MEDFQESLQMEGISSNAVNLSHIYREKAQQIITNRPGVSGLAGVMKDKLILFKHL